MNRLLQLAVALGVFASVCVAADDALRAGVPGKYSRSLGMNSETVDLKADGSYSFTTFECLGSEHDNGSWVVRDSIVILNSSRAEAKRIHPMHFLILAIDGDLALRARDDGMTSNDEHDAQLLFRPEKERADQPSQRNATAWPFSLLRAAHRGADLERWTKA